MRAGLDDVAMDLVNGLEPQDCCNSLCHHKGSSFEAVNLAMMGQNELEYLMPKDLRDSLRHHLHHLRPDYPVVTAVFAPSSNRCLGPNQLSLTKSDNMLINLLRRVFFF